MTIKKLAKELNLSFSTVSKALRDSHEISERTKQIVLEKAKEFNYQVNPFASSLRKQKSKTIAVIIPEVVNDFFGPVINGIESIAQEKGYHVLIYLTHEDMQKEIAITNLLQNGRVDGVMISLSAQTTNTSHLEILKEKEIPLVFFDRVVPKIESPKVITNDLNSSFEATEHLIENGCKKIAFLSLSETLSISNKRVNGYLDALKKHNLKLHNGFLQYCDSKNPGDNKLIRALLRKKNRPDAIFASVENLAIIAYEVCKELSLKIPEDVKILCFSNLKTVNLLNPPMTTIMQPAFEIGREGAAILFKLIEKKGHNFLKENTVIDSKLIIRESTRAN
jgi:LacI family transcriptional regulator